MWRKLNKPLLAKIRRASREYGLIQPYDKIAVGLSGGKDSTVMLYALSVLQKTLPIPFELVGISLDVGWNNDYELVGRYCRELGIPFHLEQTQIGRIVYEERKEANPCSLCANMRRGAINSVAKQLGCNKVALGHHLDDALETFLMSMVFEGRMHTFSPRTYLSRADITVIRPMIYVYEKDIISIASKLELPVVPNNCPADGLTKRTTMKEEMARFEAMNSTVRERMLNAITTTLWAPLMLPEEEQVMKPIKKILKQETEKSATMPAQEQQPIPQTQKQINIEQ
ncbi:MAG: tRNA 2-thiocytidine biosynthesis protein TtcA [Peptococcaceae bacterium]|nr:tRNA 2-thiocytidine biosynthesis protein TtcA [Peptococcaceae bacterium]